jgi:hypothetical protein
VTDRLDALLGRLPAQTVRMIRSRLGLDAFLVVAGVFVSLRLFDVSPWTLPSLDLHA